MNKTIYIRDEDVPIWERARELAGDKLSPAIVAGLKTFILEKEAEAAAAKGFERIQIKFNDATDHGIPKIKVFHGKWLFPPSKPVEVSDDEGENFYYDAIALTAKGAAVLYSWSADRGGQSFRTFTVYPSLEAAAADTRSNYAVLKAIEERGVPVEELDI